MRRRLWYQIAILDIRASEDHGSEVTVSEDSYDTQLPLNINDDDIDPSTIEPPVPRLGNSEMVLSLVRFEINKTLRRLHYANTSFAKVPLSLKVVRESELEIAATNRYLEEKYIKHLDLGDTAAWVTATIYRLVLSKAWLILHHAFQHLDGGASLPPDTKDNLFITSVEVVECSYRLENHPGTKKWAWFFRSYIQWHAGQAHMHPIHSFSPLRDKFDADTLFTSVAYIMSELVRRDDCPEVDRAWGGESLPDPI